MRSGARAVQRILCAALALSLAACASAPQVIVDPKSIADRKTYNDDRRECRDLARQYRAGNGTASAAVGAGAAVATAGLVVATGGLVLIPAGIAGAAAGGSVAQGHEDQVRQKIEAKCMTDRGYKAYVP